jgi:hypothetical protein
MFNPRRWSGPLIRGVAGLALLIPGLAVNGQRVMLVIGAVLVVATIGQVIWMTRPGNRASTGRRQ